MQEPGCRKQSECSPQQRGVPDVVHDGGDRPWQMGEIGREVLGGVAVDRDTELGVFSLTGINQKGKTVGTGSESKVALGGLAVQDPPRCIDRGRDAAPPSRGLYHSSAVQGLSLWGRMLLPDDQGNRVVMANPSVYRMICLPAAHASGTVVYRSPGDKDTAWSGTWSPALRGCSYIGIYRPP
jgi:hypothetical protein